MTAQLLSSELTNLIQESKRKHNDLRQAAERSLEELKSVRGSNEAQIAAELAQRANFVNPFIIACGSKNAKFTGIAIVCLLRLIMVSALPRSKLSPVLEALRESTSAGLDVQLKILQALPALLQNYAVDIKGDLLVTALNICFILQTSKNGIVNNTSAATLQQLVVSVFDKVVAEDKSSADLGHVGSAPSDEGEVQLRSAALDAYRVLQDICLLTENRKTEYLRFSGLAQTFGLELIESALTNHAAIFSTHPEQANILRSRVMPFLISALSAKMKFATTVRLVRILYTLLRRHLGILQAAGAEAMTILTQLLDQDTVMWRRALCMEVFRGIFADAGLLRKIYMMYDAKEGEKDVLRSLTATFVRVSTERPAVIGLGHQSTVPAANPYASLGTSTDQAMLEASGVTGIISGSVSEGHNTGISPQWSTVRVPCIDQLDKTEAPPVPESYIYFLTLNCITSLSEGLAKFVLPLTVPGENRRRKTSRQAEQGRSSPALVAEDEAMKAPLERGVATQTLERSGSFRRKAVPVNPLALKDHPLYSEVVICARFIDECWPAILATCSTFLLSALDSEYYHGLVRAFQKLAHVAGLLQLNTPRDAFLTTLGKSAVPSAVHTACMSTGGASKPPPVTEATSPGILSNARGMLSVEALVTPVGAAGERQRQASVDANSTPQTLNTRNLLCLRALLNLGIALGPTLASSWRIVLETLQQADFVLSTAGKSAGRIPVASKTPDQRAEGQASALLANFSTEVRSVETAALRLFESTIDFPNEPFLEVVNAVCNLMVKRGDRGLEASATSLSPSSQLLTPQEARKTGGQQRQSVGAAHAGPDQEDLFALGKLGEIGTINIERMLMYPPDTSGWARLVTELINTLGSLHVSTVVRLRAADILVHLVLDAAKAAVNVGDETRGKVQVRLLEAFRTSLLAFQGEERESSVAGFWTDVDIHRVILDGLKSLLDNCGETLVGGWDVAFDIIGSIFVKRKLGPDDREAETGSTIIMTRSSKLIRSSFSSLQLISSDFLSSLPNPCFLMLVDSLYKFCSQDDDLNIALTTVTFFWVLSDFLSGKSKSLPITNGLVADTDEGTLAEQAADAQNEASDAALWMLLLLRLTKVTTDERLELRNSATHTLLRIFDAYGDRLGPDGWSICIKSVIFKLMSSIQDELRSVSGPEVDDGIRREWYDSAVVVLNGISALLANYLDVLTVHPTFNSYWQQLLGHFGSLLDFHVLEINTATYKALAQILSQSRAGSKQTLNKTTIDMAWQLWARGTPVADSGKPDKIADNQDCLLAYVEALRHIYRLIQADVTVEGISRMLSLLHQVPQQATPGAFAVDVDHLTPLQAQVLDVMKILRADLPGAPSALIDQASDFVSLAYDLPTEAAERQSKRSYVAMSKASMLILQSLLIRYASDVDIYKAGALLAALTALSKPILRKYHFPTITKSTRPWKQATTSALSILEATISHLRALDIPRCTSQQIWQMIITIANGITHADCDAPAERIDLVQDQEFDMAAFTRLRELIIPALGSEVVTDQTRKMYAESLFRTSIIHAPAPADWEWLMRGSSADGMTAALDRPRAGRTADPPPTLRQAMAYLCLDELFSLLASHEEAGAPAITVQPPTPAVPPPGTPSSAQPPVEPAEALHLRLARVVAPYLIVRAALPLRAYVADQPLRGRMPQPLSQRLELARVLDRLVRLRCEADAVPGLPAVESEGGKHLFRLYPLLVKAMAVSGRARGQADQEIGRLLGDALAVVGDELGV